MSNERQRRAERAEQMRKQRDRDAKRQRNFISIAIVVVVVALVALGGWAINSASKSNEQASELLAPKNAADDYGIVYDAAAAGGEAADGKKPVEVEIYEDFQCPACQAFEQASSAYLKEKVKAGDITLVFRPFSFLDEIGGSPNEYSHRSTNLAACVLDQDGVDGYLKIHDYLYANQPQEGSAGPSNADLLKSADGLGFTGLDDCVRTGKFRPWVEEAKKKGTDRGVSGTPTVYIGGKVSEARTPAELEQAIADAAKA